MGGTCHRAAEMAGGWLSAALLGSISLFTIVPVPSFGPPPRSIGATDITSAANSSQTAESLGPGTSGPAVLALQRRLVSLHYWLGVPNGYFGDATEQAVYALQKAAGLVRDGVVGPKTEIALRKGVEPRPRPTAGRAIEVDLQDDILMVVSNGHLSWAFNTSTGGGYTYCERGGCAVANTPVGHFRIDSEIDGLVVDPLGELWRPKYFDTGFALHGDSYVPPEPVSHGCIRVSNEAIDWIWSANIAPIGTEIWVY
jgi:hypothetical protein